MTTLRVCFVIPGFADGGAQKQCIYLLNELQQRTDLRLHLIHLHPGVHDDLLRRETVDVAKLSVTSNYDPRNVFRLRRMLASIRPDILLSWLHACDTYSFFVRHSMPNIRWIMTERDSYYPSDPRYWLRRQLGRYSDGIVANSVAGKAYWDQAGARCPTFVVPNIVRLSSSYTERDRQNDSVIYVGRLEQQKNVTTVVHAFCLLATRRPDITFSVFGDGSLRSELEGIVARAGQSDRVHFRGFKPDVASDIAQAKMVVSMSHHEGLPNVVLESVSAGTPVLVSDIPEHRELLGPEYPFYVGDRGEPEVCARALESALTSSTGEEPLRFARKKISSMTASNVADSYIRIFHEIVGVRR